MRIELPAYALDVIRCLEANGFEAFVVGGCVRDSLMGVEPGDWDVCTSATPEEMQRCFAGYRVIETGLKHGTLTVRSHGENVEITTYRLDGEYKDHRRPEKVEFVRKLELDLMRRDFTVNAMAYSPQAGLIDLFGGQDDLRSRVIRCVGSAQTRFEEDALRLLRALRFAARFDFSIEPTTSAALWAKADLMAAIAAERIFVEWKKLLAAPASRRILMEYAGLFEKWIPGLCASRVQQMDFWDRLPPRADLRTGLLTDQPDILCKALKTDAAFKNRVSRFVICRDEPLPDSPTMVMRFLAASGENAYEDRLDYARAREEDIRPCVTARRQAEAEGRVWKVEDLAIGGHDLLEMGLKGPALGELRKTLLEAVMKGRLPNEKNALTDMARLLSEE